MTSQLPEERAAKRAGWRRSIMKGWRFVARATAGYGAPAVVVSLVSFVVSSASFALSFFSFHATSNLQATLTVYAGCNWLYGRGVPGSGTDVEYFIAPITAVNDGARTGTLRELELVFESDGTSKPFPANFIAASFDDKTPQMYSPIAIAGHSSATNWIVFTQPDYRDRPLFGKTPSGEVVSFPVTIDFRPVVPFSDSLFDRWFFARPGPKPRFPRIAPAYERNPTRFNVCKEA
jgi:hypothetical protein